MKLYIVLYMHRHGNDAWPRFIKSGERAPTSKSEIDQLEDFEPGRDEAVEVFGPFPIPGEVFGPFPVPGEL